MADTPTVPSVSGVTNKFATAAQEASAKLQKQLGSAATPDLTKRLNALSNTKLAESIFTAGPKDEMLTVDVLGISDANILNSLAGKLSGFDTSILESFRKGGGGGLDQITGLLSGGGAGGFSLDPKALTDRVVQSLGGSQGVLRNLSTGLQTSLTQGGGITGIFDQVSGLIDGAAVNFTTGGITDARGIFNLINNITGQSDLAQFFDIGAETNLLSGIFQEVIALGLPMAVEALLEHADSSEAADYALRNNIGIAIQHADLTTTVTLINRLGPNRILSDVPTAVQQLLKNYKFPAGTTSAQYSTLYTQLKAVLDALQPGWGHFLRNDELLTDLTAFGQASADAVKLLSLQPEWATVMKIASDFKPVGLKQAAKAMYPLAAI